MIATMKWRKLIASCVLTAAMAFPATARAAAAGPEADPTHDARTEGYASSVQIDGSTGLLWIVFLFLAIISMSALFKDSKRARAD